MRRLFLVTLLIFISKLTFASPIISGISTNEIEINTDFRGTKILLFGAKGDAGNIVIAVRGPKKNFIVTKKERLLGIWYNHKREKFEDYTSFYSLFSTFNNQKPMDKLLEDLELGKNNLKFTNNENSKQDNDTEFKAQLIENLEENKLYTANTNQVDFLDETLFKVMLDFPKNITRGIYTVEIYLINDDTLISFQTIPIYVSQTGISAKILDFAYQQSFLYGIFAILLALIIGWLTNYLFARFVRK